MIALWLALIAVAGFLVGVLFLCWVVLPLLRQTVLWHDEGPPPEAHR